MFSKVLILALVAVVAKSVPIVDNGFDARLQLMGVKNAGNTLGNIQPYRNLVLSGGVPTLTSLALGFPAISNLGAANAALGIVPTLSNVVVGGVPSLSNVVVGAGSAVSALGYGAVGGVLDGGYLSGALDSRYLSGALANLNIGRGIPVSHSGPVNAAVQTVSRTVDYNLIPQVGEPPVVQEVDVPPMESPIRINFQSRSSPLIVSQLHIPAEPGQLQVTQSEDEPQTAVHNVVRPVVQNVNEVIKPYRSLTQVVEPVKEQIHSNVAVGEGARLTGLTSGVVGGTGVVAAHGVGVAAPAVAVGGLGYDVGALNTGVVGGTIVSGGVGLGGVRLIDTGAYHNINGVKLVGLNGLSQLSARIVRF